MRIHLLGAAILAAASLNITPQAIAAEHLEVGRLDCNVSAGIGVIVGSQQEIASHFIQRSSSNLSVVNVAIAGTWHPANAFGAA
jgi:hypothetical protein